MQEKIERIKFEEEARLKEKESEIEKLKVYNSSFNEQMIIKDNEIQTLRELNIALNISKQIKLGKDSQSCA